jgi:hypothetical protein
MANITLNIDGDLNIFVSGEDGQPDCLYLDSDSGTMKIQIAATDEDDGNEANATVLYALPGEKPESMALFEALQLSMDRDGMDSLELMPECELLAAFNSDDVIIDTEGSLFLAGPVMVFKIEDGDVVSLTDDEMETARKILNDGTAKLQSVRVKLYAYGL